MLMAFVERGSFGIEHRELETLTCTSYLAILCGDSGNAARFDVHGNFVLYRT